MDYKLNRKAQVTIFVIVAVMIVAIIALVFVLRKNDADLRESDFDNPEGYLSLCIKERANSIIEEMLVGGGFIGKNDTVLYMDEKYTYLCKNINNFEPCINQYPTYVSLVEKEFNEQIQDDSLECFDSLKQAWQDKKYNFKSSPLYVESKLKPGIVEITLKSNVTIEKDKISRTYSRFDTFVYTRLSEIVFVTNEILAQEAKWCHFSTDGFRLLYRDYDVRSYLLEDTSNIYTIKYKETGETLKMAVRGCALPAGLY